MRDNPNIKLEERIRAVLHGRKGISEKKMFGGTCFLVHGKMIGGTMGGRSRGHLIMRVPNDDRSALLKKPHVRPMKGPGGRSVHGFILVGPEACNTNRKLSSWFDRGIQFVSTIS